MTRDEIIKQLESLLSHCKSMIEKDGGFPIWEKDCEALEAAIAALRPSGEPPIDREKWTAEWEEDGECHHKPYRVRDAEKWKKYKCSKCGYKAGRRTSQKYCPSCGRAMTPEAWELLEKRLRWPAERNERGEADNLDRLRKLVEADRIERHKIIPLLGKCKVHCLNCGCVLDLMDLEGP